MPAHRPDRNPNQRLPLSAPTATHPLCESYFMHTISSLRALFNVENISADHIKLPKLKRSNKMILDTLYPQ
jgi:hypothetical protein